MQMLFYVILISLFSLIFALILILEIVKKPAGNKKMQEISGNIHKGAMAFLNEEYKVLIIFLSIVALILKFLIGNSIAVSFIFGGILSALAGNIGMRIATKANSRTAEAAKSSLNVGLKIAFSSGAVMGFFVVGLGLLGVTISYYLFKDPTTLYGFGFGASFVALFARVGGGIYTKAADVGADMVGKFEHGIPEDDPRNPAVIADNVGDNVGDVAGMGADLFESYAGSIIAAMVIGLITFSSEKGVLLPLLVAAAGIVASIIGTFFVKVGKKGKLYLALNKGVFATAITMIVISYFLITLLEYPFGIFYALLSGLLAGVIIGLFTQYYTSNKLKPARSIAEAAQTGAATDIIQGLAVGMISTIEPVLAICITIIVSYYFAGLFGITIAAVGMLSILGITLATEAYGAIADNAAGIAEMAKMGAAVRKRAESLDAVGNTTAAIGKGFAIGSAALTALALFASYTQITSLTTINIVNPGVIVGLFIGAVIPFVFSSLTMKAVGKSAFKIVNEVRRQFKEIKGLLQGKAKADYNTCISICTESALKEMILPSLLAIVFPITTGLLLGTEALGGLLAGATATSFIMAIFMANSGGALDNAKKYIEEGHFGGKGSNAHKAAVVGDTVGDPLKDTAGPSLNILMKLMTIVALVFVPLFI